MSTNIRKIGKSLPRDKLRLIKNKDPPTSVMQLTPDLNEQERDLNEHDLKKPEFYSSGSEEKHVPRAPIVPRYHLQARRIQPNYHVNLL